MKIIRSISIDHEVYERFREHAQKKNTDISNGIEALMRREMGDEVEGSSAV
jgi:hypothetical protein